MRAEPSAWVARFAPLVPAGRPVLDVACGSGRHTRLFLDRSHPVVAVDVDGARLAALPEHPRLEVIQADLEDSSPWRVPRRRFGAVIVTNYLHRPLLPDLVEAVANDGLLIYETFARGQEHLGRPSNPDFLLLPGELLDAVQGHLRVLAYEDRAREEHPAACLQRLCARREGP